MPLSDDEYSCLMIMATGQNLIRMRDTRWHAPLNSLEAKGFCKPIGNENFVITRDGHMALQGHQETLDGDLRNTITKHGQVQDARHAVHAKMQTALAAVVDGARMAALTTGAPEKSCLKDIMREIELRAGEALQ